MRRIGLLFLLSLCVMVVAASVGFRAQPTAFRIARTRPIPATPGEIRASVEDVRVFATLLPKHGDKPVQVTFSHKPTGVGAWVESRDDQGASRTSIVAATDSRIELKTETSGKVLNGSSRTLIELTADTASGPPHTSVTWALEGELSGLRRALWPFISLDRMVGPDLEAGLGRIETVVTEARAK